jgi:hypothetical protein
MSIRSAIARLAVLVSGCLMLTLAVLSAAPLAEQGGQVAPAAQTGPRASEVYKNIQVLTDLPADQLDVTMRYMAAATGFECSGCHVREATGEYSYDKDDRRAKQTARRMIALVNAINAGDFGVRAACATCHAGRNRPAGLQLSTSASPEEIAARAARQGGSGRTAGAPPPGAGQGRGRQQGPPPAPVDDVLAKFVAAIGGAQAVERLQSRTIVGTMTNRFGEATPVTIDEKAPNLHRETMGSGADAESRGFDGSNGWLRQAGRVEDLPAFPVQQMLRMADLRLAARLGREAASLQAGRATQIDGRAMNRISVPATAGAAEQFLFDAETGLAVRRTVSTRTPLGTLIEQYDYSDYRDVGGVKMPFTITHTTWNAVDTLKVTEIKANPPLADAIFTKPRG